jgi:hypothetical protein
VGQGVALALGARAQQELAHRRAQAHAHGGHVGLDELHGVVDGHARGHRAARAVDVEPDVLVGLVARQVQQLGADDVGDVVVDLGAQEDDALTEEAVEDLVRRADHRRVLRGRENQAHGR